MPRTRLDDFREFVAARHGVTTDDYWDLHRWSVDHMADFWGAVWEFFDVRASVPPTEVLVDAPMPGQRWFEEARLSYVDQVMRHRDLSGAAIVTVHEDGSRDEVRWADLEPLVASVAHSLRELGVGEGDRVAGYLTNGVEAIVAFLATASLGAVWAGCAPEDRKSVV